VKIFELIIKNLQWLIILNTGYGYYTRLEEHNLQVEQILQEKPAIEEQITKLKKKVDEAKIFLANLEVSKKRVQEVAGQIEQVQRQLPNTIDDTAILDFFSTEAQQLNIQLNLTPGVEESRDFYIAKKYNIKGTGTYLQYMIFMERIASSERLINVQSIKLISQNEKQKGRFQMLGIDATLESFKYNSAYKEDTGISKIEEEFKAKDAPSGRRKRKKGGE
jgi:Tfp pilus assembly protein PilO